MDGRVLKEIFKKESVHAHREVLFSESRGTNETEVFERSREDEKRVEERLRSLGYLS